MRNNKQKDYHIITNNLTNILLIYA
jgi:hypothetical protein